MRSDRFVTSCPACGQTAFTSTEIRLRQGVLLRCSACSQLVSQCSAAEYAQSASAFDTEAGTLPSAATEPRHLQRVRRWLANLAALNGLSPQEMRILDVGCSSGSFLRTAGELGYRRLMGVEPCTLPAAAAREAGLEVICGTLEEAAFPAASFDVVTLFEVIEHLQDPASLFAEIRRVLVPGGLVLVGTPNTDSWTAAALGASWDIYDMDRFGGHISFFNTRSMERFARRCGFTPVRIETRRVQLAQRDKVSPGRHRLMKTCAELVSLPARLLGKGHDMLAYLQADA